MTGMVWQLDSEGRSPCRSMDSIIERMNRRGISTSSIQVNIRRGRVVNVAQQHWVCSLHESRNVGSHKSQSMAFVTMSSWQPSPGQLKYAQWAQGPGLNHLSIESFSAFSEISRMSLCFVGLGPHYWLLDVMIGVPGSQSKYDGYSSLCLTLLPAHNG